MSKNALSTEIAVVIPSYKVAQSLPKVVQSIGPEVAKIIVVDDFCPQKSGKVLLESNSDPRVILLQNSFNQGVGGATIVGYKFVLETYPETIVIVKVDGDGQMDTSQITNLVDPILNSNFDYSKGNRFIDFESIQEMPKIRVLGNAVLSFFSKFSSGYWNILDPNNGFTAISTKSLRRIPLTKIDKRYFFESDMLFRLNLINARVKDVPMNARYGEEVSNLKIRSAIFKFLFGHSRNFFKRLVYKYFLQGMSVASIELLSGIIFVSFGLIFGSLTWLNAGEMGAPTGSIVLSSMTIILGFQLLLAFISYDISTSNHEMYPK